MTYNQGRINLSRQSVHRFGGLHYIFTVKTDDLSFSRHSFNLCRNSDVAFCPPPIVRKIVNRVLLSAFKLINNNWQQWV